jgi:hypothetical protein
MSLNNGSGAKGVVAHCISESSGIRNAKIVVSSKWSIRSLIRAISNSASSRDRAGRIVSDVLPSQIFEPEERYWSSSSANHCCEHSSQARLMEGADKASTGRLQISTTKPKRSSATRRIAINGSRRVENEPLQTHAALRGDPTACSPASSERPNEINDIFVS